MKQLETVLALQGEIAHANAGTAWASTHFGVARDGNHANREFIREPIQDVGE